MRASRRLGLAILTTLSACRRPSPAPEALPSPPVARVLEIPSSKSSLDPLQVWKRELSELRVSRLPQLSWSCSNPQEIAVDLSASELDCSQVKIATDRPNLDFSCNEARLSVRTECSGDSAPPPALHSLWITNASRPFIPDEKAGQLRIVPGSDRLAWTETPQGNLRVPTAKQWMQQGQSSGPLGLSLELVTEDKEARSALWSLLQRLKEPQDLPLYLELPQKVPLLGPRATESHFLFQISQMPSTSPAQESCEYVGQWLQARQLLLSKTLRGLRTRELRCQVEWYRDLLATRGIILSRLPLPLFVMPKGTYPFKTEEESLNPAVFKALLDLR